MNVRSDYINGIAFWILNKEVTRWKRYAIELRTRSRYVLIWLCSIKSRLTFWVITQNYSINLSNLANELLLRCIYKNELFYFQILLTNLGWDIFIIFFCNLFVRLAKNLEKYSFCCTNGNYSWISAAMNIGSYKIARGLDQFDKK